MCKKQGHPRILIAWSFPYSTCRFQCSHVEVLTVGDSRRRSSPVSTRETLRVYIFSQPNSAEAQVLPANRGGLPPPGSAERVRTGPASGATTISQYCCHASLRLFPVIPAVVAICYYCTTSGSQGLSSWRLMNKWFVDEVLRL